MKIFFLILLLVNGSFYHQQLQPAFEINSFKKLPDRFSDCGNGWYYLSKQSEDKKRYICVTDYDIVLIYINHRPLWLKHIGEGNSYVSGKYTLIIKDGTSREVGDETSKMKSLIVIKYEEKIIWRKYVIGYNGC